MSIFILITMNFELKINIVDFKSLNSPVHHAYSLMMLMNCISIMLMSLINYVNEYY